MEKIVNTLKEIITQEGPGYLDHNAYPVYKKLISQDIFPLDARLVLLTLLARIHQEAANTDAARLSSRIQKECCLKKSKADKLTSMYLSLFDVKNMNQWKENKDKGFAEFCGREWTFRWNGDAVWHYGSGHVNCYCSVEAIFQVRDKSKARKEIAGMLKENPFTTAEKLYKHFEEKLMNLLDEDLEDYVTAEAYYEPVMEDYYSEDIVEKFCDGHGLELIAFEGDGSASDYEPDDYRYGW